MLDNNSKSGTIVGEFGYNGKQFKFVWLSSILDETPIITKHIIILSKKITPKHLKTIEIYSKHIFKNEDFRKRYLSSLSRISRLPNISELSNTNSLDLVKFIIQEAKTGRFYLYQFSEQTNKLGKKIGGSPKIRTNKAEYIPDDIINLEDYTKETIENFDYENDKNLEKLVAAREAFVRAVEESKRLKEESDSFEKKTIASDGVKTLSGYGPIKPNIPRKVPASITHDEEITGWESMMEHSDKIHHNLAKRGDQDAGVAGRSASTHAEKQNIAYHLANGENKPLGVSRQQCGDCRRWFVNLAMETQQEYVLCDPEFTRVYTPDKNDKTKCHVDIYDSVTLIKIKSVDIKNYRESQDINGVKYKTFDPQPIATIRVYEFIAW